MKAEKEHRVGDIIGQATRKEIKTLQELSEGKESFKNVYSGLLSAAHAIEKELIKESNDFWKTLYRKYNLPNDLHEKGLTASINHVTGNISVIRK
jgi:hypothetical protein